MEFEKWQALGNDYVIVEAGALPFALTAGRVRAICAPHTGVFADGVLLLESSEEPRYAARLRIFNPDGSEAELSGNGSREAALYLRRRGLAGGEQFSILTGAGEIRPRITSPTQCTMDMGRGRLASDDFPGGPASGEGTLSAGGRSWSFRHVQVGNPQCAIRVAGEAELDELDLQAVGPEIERHERFPHRTNVSWFTQAGPGRIRARIFERGAGETSASGTGAMGAAVAFVLAGGTSPVTVVLEGGELVVEVDAELNLRLAGWAVPVFRGALSEDFLKELHAIE